MSDEREELIDELMLLSGNGIVEDTLVDYLLRKKKQWQSEAVDNYILDKHSF